MRQPNSLRRNQLTLKESHMRKWTTILAAAALSLTLSASAWACNTSNGEVLNINADARTIAMKSASAGEGGSCCPSESAGETKANQVVFKLKKETKILINGKDATLADLKAGDKVKVDYEQLDDVLRVMVTRNS
jgi:Cu/Ag efflux protein CusF